MSVNCEYKVWRNKARRFSSKSIVGMCLWRMQDFDIRCDGKGVHYLKSAPWVVALCVKWVMIHRDESKVDIGHDDFHVLMQKAWEINSLPNDEAGVEGGYLFFRRIMRPQLGFQYPLNGDFARIPFLFDSLDPGSRLRRIYENAFGVDPKGYVLCSMAFIGAMENGRRNFSPADVDAIAAAVGRDNLHRFLSVFGADFNKLREYFIGISGDKRSEAEVSEFPSLVRYPIYFDNGYVRIWDKNLFVRALEVVPHRLMSIATDYQALYGGVFERYVFNEFKKISRLAIGGREISRLLDGDSGPDGVVELEAGRVIVEAKSGIYSEPLMTALNKREFSTKSKMISKAIGQGCGYVKKFVREVRSFHLVVTNIELGIGNGFKYKSMVLDGSMERFGYDDEAIDLGCVFIISVADMERCAVNFAGDVQAFYDFLCRCYERDLSPETSCALFDMHMDKEGLQRGGGCSSDFIEQCISPLLRNNGV